MDRQYCMYLEAAEKQKMIDDYKLEVASKKLDLMLESLERRVAIQLKEAEVKVLAEGGTYSDLDYLYNAIYTEAEVAKEKMGIGERILYLINKIIEGFKGLLSGKNGEVAVEPEATYNVGPKYGAAKGILGSIKAGIAALLGVIKGGVASICKFAGDNGAILGIGAIGGFLGSALKNKIDEIMGEYGPDKEESNVKTEAADDENITGAELQEFVKSVTDTMSDLAELQKEVNDIETQLNDNSGGEVMKEDVDLNDENSIRSRIVEIQNEITKQSNEVRNTQKSFDELKEKEDRGISLSAGERSKLSHDKITMNDMKKNLQKLNEELRFLQLKANEKSSESNKSQENNGNNTTNPDKTANTSGETTAKNQKDGKGKGKGTAKKNDNKGKADKTANTSGETTAKNQKNGKSGNGDPEIEVLAVGNSSNGKKIAIIQIGGKKEEVTDEQVGLLKKGLNKIKEWTKPVTDFFKAIKNWLGDKLGKKRQKKIDKLQEKIDNNAKKQEETTTNKNQGNSQEATATTNTPEETPVKK